MKIQATRKIIEKYNTPLYIFNSNEFKNNFTELEEEFRHIYTKFKIAYSFKSNYMPYVCKIALDLGAYGEVVSDLEYNMAKRFGYSPSNIICNGPGKWYGLREMIYDGAIVMVDNDYELDAVIKIANESPHPARIGFRLNFDIGTNRKSRFGFDPEETGTCQSIARARNHNNIEIVGLHYHLGGSRSLNAWGARAKKIIHYADKLLRDEEQQILDIGSGMFGHIHPDLAVQFNQTIPSFREYASIVAGIFDERYQSVPLEKKPMLVVEPGSTIVANTMCYATKVIAVKSIRGRNIAVVDGSVHQLGEIGKKKKLPISVIHHFDNNTIVDADITGYTCLEDDVLYEKYCNSIGFGDIIIFENAGAYTNVMKPPFIQAGCQIISYDGDDISIIKRNESVNDILLTYKE